MPSLREQGREQESLCILQALGGLAIRHLPYPVDCETSRLLLLIHRSLYGYALETSSSSCHLYKGGKVFLIGFEPICYHKEVIQPLWLLGMTPNRLSYLQAGFRQ